MEDYKVKIKPEPSFDISSQQPEEYLSHLPPPPNLSPGVDPTVGHSLPKKKALWKNHSDSFMKAAQRLFQSNELCDFIVSCSDRDVHVHKLVLAAQSGYFKNMFSNDRTMEMIQITGNSEIIAKIIEYLYFGSVLLDETEVEEFKTMAHMFEIEGFEEKDEKPAVMKAGKGKGKNKAGGSGTKRKHSEIEEEKEKVHTITDEEDDSKKIKTEDQGEKGIQKLVNEYLDLGDGSFSCQYCHKITKGKHSVVQHIGLIHTGEIKDMKCFHCDFTSKIKSNLKKHCVKKHNMVPQHFDKLAKAHFGK